MQCLPSLLEILGHAEHASLMQILAGLPGAGPALGSGELVCWAWKPQAPAGMPRLGALTLLQHEQVTVGRATELSLLAACRDRWAPALHKRVTPCACWSLWLWQCSSRSLCCWWERQARARPPQFSSWQHG